MPFRKLLLALPLGFLALSACAPGAVHPVVAAPARPDWAFEASDLRPDPAIRFGKLANGMRYVIRPNTHPAGTAMVRMQVEAGSLDESDDERGYAHFVEHMAFNGSTHVPEGEMIKLLERDGLAFGADTNASTTYQRTTYKLDLPRNDAALLDTALMLMRETASELTFAPEAVARERGVVLSEMRDRNSFALHAYQDQIGFLAPGSRMENRLPIGTEASLLAASAPALKAFWQREYRPGHVTLVVVGDFEAVSVEAAIARRFGDWQAPAPEPLPLAGPLSLEARDQGDVHVDPALSERVTVVRKGPWLNEPDTRSQRREALLRQIAYGAINRRLLSRTREADAPFRAASLWTSDIFREGRMSQLAIDTVDAKWRRGLIAAAGEYRLALTHGFTPEEIAEQLAIIRNAARTSADAEATRSNAQLLGGIMALIDDEQVPVTPAERLAQIEADAAEATPEAVLAALRRELVTLDQPLVRFQGRVPPAGGADGLRQAWAEAMKAPLPKPAPRAQARFAYTDFGPPGAVVADAREPVLGIRQLRFANGVRLNLKRTELEKERVLVQVSIDGGNMLATRDNPLATRMVPVLALGGLGKHSKDELDSLLAGHTVSTNLAATDETFVATAATTPRDLELQLQVLAAQITDPGYRPEGQVLFRQTVNNMFASLRATPGSALSAELGAILSDSDPRFSLGKVEDYRRLTFDKLRQDLSDRLGKGAIEIGIVGDIEEDAAIALVARTFGALPARESEFRPYAEARQRPFAAARTRRVLHHAGARDQALVTMTWPARDGEDPVVMLQFSLLERVVGLVLSDTLREALGKAYSPGASANLSRSYRGYGTFSVSASVDVGQVEQTRAAILDALAALARTAPSDDLIQRARAPLLKDFDNLLKSNAGWLAYVDRAQTEPDRIERLSHARERLSAITAAQLQQLVQAYLAPGKAVEVDVLPDGVEEAAP